MHGYCFIISSFRNFWLPHSPKDLLSQPHSFGNPISSHFLLTSLVAGIGVGVFYPAISLSLLKTSVYSLIPYQIFSVSVSVYCMHTCLWRSEEGGKCSGLQVTVFSRSVVLFFWGEGFVCLFVFVSFQENHVPFPIGLSYLHSSIL